jgi:hypothetical protein
VENEKSFLQELYKALEAEETHDNTEATSPTRGLDGSEVFLVATDPPGDGGAKNRVVEGLTYYQEDTLKLHLPGKDPKASSLVGAPPIPLANPPVGGVCKADGDGPQKLLELLQEIGRSTLPFGNRELWRKVGTVVFMVPWRCWPSTSGLAGKPFTRWKKALEEKGLIATDVLHQKVNGEYRAIGTLWAVRLRPGKARLHP